MYPQSRASTYLFETQWNNPFNVLTDAGGFFYQQFIDADGDGDVVSENLVEVSWDVAKSL